MFPDSRSPAPWEVYFDTFDHFTRHLPQLTATGLRLRPGSPAQRALEEGERRSLQSAWKVHGLSYAKAFALAARLNEAALAWLRQDGVDRGALRQRLAEAEPEAPVMAAVGMDDDEAAWAE